MCTFYQCKLLILAFEMVFFFRILFFCLRVLSKMPKQIWMWTVLTIWQVWFVGRKVVAVIPENNLLKFGFALVFVCLFLYNFLCVISSLPSTSSRILNTFPNSDFLCIFRFLSKSLRTSTRWRCWLTTLPSPSGTTKTCPVTEWVRKTLPSSPTASDGRLWSTRSYKEWNGSKPEKEKSLEWSDWDRRGMETSLMLSVLIVSTEVKRLWLVDYLRSFFAAEKVNSQPWNQNNKTWPPSTRSIVF